VDVVGLVTCKLPVSCTWLLFTFLLSTYSILTIPNCCAVLVVTGDTDRLVPAWNTRRLASALPNAKFELIKKCGHMPQEETPDELLSIIESFLTKTFSSKPIPVPT
jgi:pimeloyl-ACP methyl ester carboxylesterase